MFPGASFIVNHKSKDVVGEEEGILEDINYPTTLDVAFYVSELLLYQDKFKKITTPYEQPMWDESTLQAFCIDKNEIDRLYYIERCVGNFQGITLKLAVRIKQDGKPIYVEFRAVSDIGRLSCSPLSCHIYGVLRCRGNHSFGFIFLTKDATVFTRTALRCYTTKMKQCDNINQSTPANQFYKTTKDEQCGYNKCPSTLANLCCRTVYADQRTLQSYRDLLPMPLVVKVDKYKAMQEALVSYRRLIAKHEYYTLWHEIRPNYLAFDY